MSHNGQISEVPRANGLGHQEEEEEHRVTRQLLEWEMVQTEAKWGPNRNLLVGKAK